MELSEQEATRLVQLREKYTRSGQDMLSYLEGLVHTRYLTYWDYLHLDSLLSLQTPRTEFPDELIFITYHQITELYFKLSLHELDQLTANGLGNVAHAEQRLSRLHTYAKQLAHSFDIMVEGMQPSEFLQFRMALLPASGFQSVQFRLLEIKFTSLYRLYNEEHRANAHAEQPLEVLYENIYWKHGNRELQSGNKTLTLEMFEQRYDTLLLNTAQQYSRRNLYTQYLNAAPAVQEVLKPHLRQIDLLANVFWRLGHYRSAARYLHKQPEDIRATGGTNWQQYLPPRFQRVIFFPEVWTEQERAEWGKAWVAELFKDQVESHWQPSSPPAQPQ